MIRRDKDLSFKAKAKTKNSKSVLEDISRPWSKAKDNNTDDTSRRCLGGAVVRASDLRSSGRGFDSRPGRNQVT